MAKFTCLQLAEKCFHPVQIGLIGPTDQQVNPQDASATAQAGPAYEQMSSQGGSAAAQAGPGIP
ncbi:hypothetical protein NPIL_102191, partial [Nephila pilipes]